MKKTASSSFAIVSILLFLRLGFAAPMTRAGGFSPAGLPGRGLSPDQVLHSGRFANSSNSIFASAPRSIDPALATPEDAGTVFTADLVLGWPNFKTPFPDPFLATVGIPTGVAIDRSVTPNRIYVADRATSRISGWSNVNALTNGAPADLILGQPTFFSSGANNGTLPGDVNGLGPDSLNFPVGLAVDNAGNVYVADELNHRVLEYNQPYASCSSLPCVGPAASVVFGQGSGMGASGGSFTTAVAAAGKAGLNFPQGVAVDSNGNVFIADTANNRVLEYDTPLANASSPNVTANRVYGEGAAGNDFDTVDGGTSQVLLFVPVGVGMDSNNDLFVADLGNSRVAEFDNPVSANNFLMTRVFGQEFANNFSGSDEGIADQSHTSDPDATAFDSHGDLYISDTANNRVLEFVPPFPSDNSTVLNAAAVWGQGSAGNDFTSHVCYAPEFGNPPPSASTMCQPEGIAFDSADNMYSVDNILDRVLEFKPTTAGTPPPAFAASIVLGQVNFTIIASGPAFPYAFFFPTVAIDQTVTPNRIYVVDNGENRILGWRNIDSLTNGQSADLVIGQPDFISGGCNDGVLAGDVDGLGPDSLCFPTFATVDSSGNLWAGDSGDSRVLEYNKPFEGCASFPCVGPAANLAIGQSSPTDFTHAVCAQPPNLTASGLCGPQGVAFDASNNLYVADTNNSRVLEYDNPLATPGSPNVTANVVFGQGTTGGGTEFTTAVCADGLNGDPAPSANTLCQPTGITVDSHGNLYVSDFADCRAIEYNTPLANAGHPNVTANVVWGQNGDFTTAICSDGMASDPPVSATGLSFPYDIKLDALDNLYVADEVNNRVLEFNTPLANPSSPNLTADAVWGQGATGNSFTTNAPGVGTAGLNFPSGLSLDSTNRLYIADSGQARTLRFPKASASPTATPVPGQAGRIVAPSPVTVSASGGESVKAGSFSYTNTTEATQNIGAIVVTVSDPSVLASLTASVGGSSSTVAPVTATTSVPFSPPISVAAKTTITFTLTAQAAGGSSAIAPPVAYADVLMGHSPMGPLGCGLMLLGLVLMPMGIRTRRRAIVVALAAIALSVTIAGCGGSSGSSSGSTRTSVSGTGALNKPAPLSTIKVSGTPTVQRLTALSFD